MQTLRIIPLAGQDEFNDLEKGVMAPLVVQVLDQNARPVQGADVVFRFPLREPSAVFANEQSSKTVRTNADGQAAADGWTARGVGRFQVRVTATRGAEIGEATISMTNATRVGEEAKRQQKKSIWSSKWVKIGIIAAAAGAVTGIVLATRGGGGSEPVIIASPGSPTIGGPQ
jgi:hypothetical protein